MMLVIILDCSSFLVLPIDFFDMSMVYITLQFLCAKLFAMNVSVTQDASIMLYNKIWKNSLGVYNFCLLLGKS